MEALELLNDEYGHCGECHEVHYIPEMVVVDGYYYCKSCSRPTPRAADEGDSQPPIYVFSVRDLSTKKADTKPALHR